MKHQPVVLAFLCLGASLHAAERTTAPADALDAQPAVETSPATALDPEVGRGNPRRQQVLPGTGVDDVAANANANANDSGNSNRNNDASRATGPAAPQASPASQAAPAAREAAPGSADRIELEATQITGNAELPRVMYVVPWKRPELGELGGRPAKSLLDEVLAPVDRDVFRRQNSYYEALRPDAAPEQP